MDIFSIEDIWENLAKVTVVSQMRHLSYVPEYRVLTHQELNHKSDGLRDKDTLNASHDPNFILISYRA